MSDLHIQVQLALHKFFLDVNLKLPGTGLSAIFGPSGSGKTTLLRTIAGLEKPQAGYIKVGTTCWLDKQNNKSVPTHRRKVGYVFQEASLFPHLSVRQNIEYGFNRVPKNQCRFQPKTVVEMLGIGHLLSRATEKLSGGERQRIAIARALLASPDILLMDEPLAALDRGSKQDILPYIRRVKDDLQIPVLYVSHALEEVIPLADHLVLMESGQVKAQGPLVDLLTRRELPLIHWDNASAVITARVEQHDCRYGLTYLRFSGGAMVVEHLDHAVGDQARVAIQARDVSLVLEKPEHTSILNIFPGTVIDCFPEPPARCLVRLTVGESILLARVTQKSFEQLKLVAGQAVYVQIKAVALMD